MTRATWTNGKRTIGGSWDYYWPADRFDIVLDGRDRVTGRPRRFSVLGEESPEWGRWKLVREPASVGASL